MQKFIHSITGFVICVALTSCAVNTRPPNNLTSLPALQGLYNSQGAQVRKLPAMSRIREMALRETALSLGAQAGLSSRAETINSALVKQSPHLDAIFNFNSITLEHNILPPVLLEGQNTLNLADAQTIRISDQSYKVAKQARFITTPPNWHQYLWMDYKEPELPDTTLLPKNAAERTVWVQYVEKGWHNGIEQANTILEENIARIKEDFGGMVLYRKLLAMNMVSPPYVSHTDLGITGNSDEIHIDDRVLRITALPGLNINSEEWRAAVAKDEDKLKQLNELDTLVKQAKITITNRAWQPIITPAATS